MSRSAEEQAARDRAHIRDYTCGLCEEEFGSNLSPGDIRCTNCEARLCPCCGAWFTEDGEVAPAEATAEGGAATPGQAAYEVVYSDVGLLAGLWGALEPFQRDRWERAAMAGGGRLSAVRGEVLAEVLDAFEAALGPDLTPEMRGWFAQWRQRGEIES